jgi:hypothetical protein
MATRPHAITLFALTLCARAASAQSTQPTQSSHERAASSNATPAADLATPPAAPSAAAAAPSPTTAEAPSTALPIPVQFYGTLWTSATLSTAVESFTYPNSTAITAAANPAVFSQPNDLFLSFQVQQSRVGVRIGDRWPVRGQLEIDFIHFDLSSPTVQAYPRVRIAEVAWLPNEHHSVSLGQGWDLFSPLNAHTANLVGNYFTAGNSGFMRHQLRWVGSFGALELAAAVGMPGANAGPTFANFETGALPTGALRVSYRRPKLWFGASFVGTAARFATATASERREALGANVFIEASAGPVEVRAEGYVGDNLASLGALTLAAGRYGQSVSEMGGWASLKVTAGMHQLYANVGAAAVLDPAVLALGYTPATMTAAATRTPAAGPGILSNISARMGYQINPWRGLGVAIEPFVYRTVHKQDDASTVSGERLALGATLAAMLTF